ncbi:hypothetical protein HDV03_003635 [Kappamyces sp. JEL0829]|nr:hypothetical protein HDV03_003635 [Kappamyces sp. JEL0829]
MSEIIKLVVSTFVHLKTTSVSSPGQLWDNIFGASSDFWVMTLPALLYFVQNVLNFMAATYLDPATMQITAQLKIFTTAMFSVAMLGRKLTLEKWLTLTMVLGGIIMVQMQNAREPKEAKSQLVGIVCIVLSSTTSGFAGVWFEKCLKGKQVSLFLRNIQLSLASIVLGFVLGVCLMDGAKVSEFGFFTGYSIWTWLSILMMSFGGLLVSFVVKYADSILKVLATTLAFIVSAVASIFLFNFQIGWYFVVGSIIVLSGSQMYILGVPERVYRLLYSMRMLSEKSYQLIKD